MLKAHRGYHMTLASTSCSHLLSAEYGAGCSSIKTVEQRSGHANHALHLVAPVQLITQSSADRYRKLDNLIKENKLAELTVLRDNSGPSLPIRRDDPADLDEQNTLATVLMDVSRAGISWEIYSDVEGSAAYAGRQTRQRP